MYYALASIFTLLMQCCQSCRRPLHAWIFFLVVNCALGGRKDEIDARNNTNIGIIVDKSGHQRQDVTVKAHNLTAAAKELSESHTTTNGGRFTTLDPHTYQEVNTSSQSQSVIFLAVKDPSGESSPFEVANEILGRIADDLQRGDDFKLLHWFIKKVPWKPEAERLWTQNWEGTPEELQAKLDHPGSTEQFYILSKVLAKDLTANGGIAWYSDLFGTSVSVLALGTSKESGKRQFITFSVYLQEDDDEGKPDPALDSILMQTTLIHSLVNHKCTSDPNHQPTAMQNEGMHEEDSEQQQMLIEMLQAQGQSKLKDFLTWLEELIENEGCCGKEEAVVNAADDGKEAAAKDLVTEAAANNEAMKEARGLPVKDEAAQEATESAACGAAAVLVHIAIALCL